ncbi:MAG: YhdP family protein [Lysobacter sp.]
MPTPLRRRFRLVRRGLGYTVAIALVLLALVLAVANQLLPLAERHPDHVATWLSQRAGRPVGFDAVETAWTRRGPLLQLKNLRIGDGDNAFTVGDAEMLVSIYAGLLPGVPLSEVRLRGLDLTLERLPDGQWQVRGLPGQQQAGGDPFASLEGLGELQVSDGALAVLAPEWGVDVRVPKIDLRLQVNGDRVRAGLRAWPRDVGSASQLPIDAMLDFDHRSGNGKVYSQVDRIDLAPWSALLKTMGVSVQAGHGQARVWVGLRDKRVVGVALEAALDKLVLVGNTIAAGDGAGARAGMIPVVRVERVATRARWQAVDGGWRLEAPSLTLDMQGRQYSFDGLLLAAGARQAVAAQHIDIAPLASIALLSDRLSPALRRWLVQAKPRGVLQDVDLQGHRGGPVKARVRIDGFGFEPVADAPGLNGLAGELTGDDSAFSLALDPGQPVQFDWPSGFGVVHAVKLDGTVTGWRAADEWAVGTASLRIDGGDFGAGVRGGLSWQADGSRPRIDIATDIDPTRLSVAKGFWVRHLMSDGLVDWLDAALVDGVVRDGRAVVSGDLDDWPFDNNDGRFEATGHIVDATVAFRPDWPAATGMDLQASFVGNGFSLAGRGILAGIDIPVIKAGIDHYDHGDLTVEAKAGTDVAQLVSLLRSSPLRELNPETFDAIEGSGPAKVDFRLQLPLAHDHPLSIVGGVGLANAKLADPRWDLAFDQVSGRLRYSEQGFRADNLQVRHDGRPGRLSLRAGADSVRDRANAFEGDLEAALGADTLLARAPELDWLAPYLSGRSQWSVGVVVPSKSGNHEPAARLKLASDLVGTALGLPAPLDKPAGARLETTVEMPLPMGSGEVRVALGDLLGLRARSGEGRTGVRVALGSGEVVQPAPATGLFASGRAAEFDAIGWIGLARGGEGSGALPLGRIDVRADRLQLLGGVFPDTRMQVTPAVAGAVSVQADGPALQGSLRVPAASGSTVSGRFQRVHWRSAKATGTARTNVASAPAKTAAITATNDKPDDKVDEQIDPARIPPLAVDIDELRIAEASLGSARLRTRATASGMEVEQFHAQMPGQTIDVSGSWNGRGAAARTRVDARLKSEDFGRLMTGFGYGGRLDGGDGDMTLDASWQGGPMQFGLTSLTGRLRMQVNGGRLLEIEPGAGRVLGLLSVAELPRRLTLDFRDFFSKGFAFNQAGGDIRIADGVASSENLRIDGPAARINIRGAANLREETFNQTIEVLPKAGNLLTVAGALAGGPVGAAIGAAANAVLQKPLGQIGAKTYRVTGPWSEPKVEVISREQERAVDKPLPAG